MPPHYQFKLGQRVTIRAQQSTGTIFAQGRNPKQAQNFYTVKIDANQPLVTIHGVYTAWENELDPVPSGPDLGDIVHA